MVASATLQRQSEVIAESALARLTAEIDALQRQLDRAWDEISRSEGRVTHLTDAKFVTYRTLIDSQAEKVALALEATEKAIGKAEAATSKAIDKAELANNDRFAAVNEFRAQLADLISRFATLERVDLLYNQTRQRIEEVERHMGDRITEISTRVTAIEQFARGVQGSRTGLYAAIGAAVGLIAIVVFVANLITK